MPQHEGLFVPALHLRIIFYQGERGHKNSREEAPSVLLPFQYFGLFLSKSPILLNSSLAPFVSPDCVELGRYSADSSLWRESGFLLGVFPKTGKNSKSNNISKAKTKWLTQK